MVCETGDGYYAGSNAVSTGNTATAEKQALRERLTPDAGGLILVLVGLPARGKSFTSRKIERFFLWKGTTTRTFNVGKYRRDGTAAETSGRSEFFDSANISAVAAREAAADAALADALGFLDSGGNVAILDATNSTRERRKRIGDFVSAHRVKYAHIFVEVICDDVEVIEANMMNKISNSPDFKGLSREEGIKDIKLRISKYEAVYETVEDGEGAFIKLFNLSSKVMANHCYGRNARSILPFLMSIHIGARPIWLVRAGAGEANPQSPHTGDRVARLSQAGRSFATTLSRFVQSEAKNLRNADGNEPEVVQVYTSTMPRAVASVSDQDVLQHHEQTSVLNPIDKGAIGAGWWDVECQSDVPPWDELQQRNPEFWKEWERDPLRCRFPGGESYLDVLRRLEALLIEVEQCTRPVLIVSHITTLQLLAAYFKGEPVAEAWKKPFPKGVVLEATPTLGGSFVCTEHVLMPEPAPSSPSDGLSPCGLPDAGDCSGGAAVEPVVKRARVSRSGPFTWTHA